MGKITERAKLKSHFENFKPAVASIKADQKAEFELLKSTRYGKPVNNYFSGWQILSIKCKTKEYSIFVTGEKDPSLALHDALQPIHPVTAIFRANQVNENANAGIEIRLSLIKKKGPKNVAGSSDVNNIDEVENIGAALLPGSVSSCSLYDKVILDSGTNIHVINNTVVQKIISSREASSKDRVYLGNDILQADAVVKAEVRLKLGYSALSSSSPRKTLIVSPKVWRKILGHPGIKAIESLPNNVDGCDFDSTEKVSTVDYEPCLLSKTKAIVSRRSEKNWEVSIINEEIHMVVVSWDIVEFSTALDGSKYLSHFYYDNEAYHHIKFINIRYSRHPYLCASIPSFQVDDSDKSNRKQFQNGKDFNIDGYPTSSPTVSRQNSEEADLNDLFVDDLDPIENANVAGANIYLGVFSSTLVLKQNESNNLRIHRDQLERPPTSWRELMRYPYKDKILAATRLELNHLMKEAMEVDNKYEGHT
ncbi:hypothetical protein EV44_g3422 [Erysiphe necator]|uniref:Uncharacterized protein n=1 Tax=Uncinula necator TaxID=52586 RepID=A0A0B1PBI6_UNCNE|nr:hypothetical protein EV44_g3422 [Erysiphe necator]